MSNNFFEDLMNLAKKDSKPQWVKDIEEMNKKMQNIGNKPENNDKNIK